MKSPRLVVLVALTLFAACDLGTSISADDYNRQCTGDEECVPVAEGNKCNLERCSCPGTAINRDDVVRYQEDFGSLICVNPSIGPVCLCAEVEGFCDDGTCGIRSAPR
jgi:hypothetical protein